MRPDRTVVTHSGHGIAVDGPGPGIASELTWSRGKRPASRAVVTLVLVNVRSLDVLLHDAGFHAGQHGTLQVRTDGSTVVHVGGRTVHLAKGHAIVRFTA
jgi:hypothetical protein